MPSYLIVHSQPPGGRADLFAQPPTLDVSGSQARLDWGDTTLEVPPGDHRVTVSVATVAGGREGAVLTVRVLPETGTRVSFAPPAQAGQPSGLRVDGQWPADAAMAYYAARDRRPFGRAAPQPAQPGAMPSQPAPAGTQSHTAQAPQQPAVQAQSSAAQPPAPQPRPAPAPSVPPVGPSIGSTGSVPVVAPASSAPTFGQMQGAVVEPGSHAPQQQPVQQSWQPPAGVAPPSARQQPSIQQPAGQQPPMRQSQPAWQPPAGVAPRQSAAPQQAPVQQHPTAPRQPWQQGAPAAFGAGAPQQQPTHPDAAAFGQQPTVRLDAYGRGLVDGDRSAPPIPTPGEYEGFARAERERHEAEAIAAARQQPGWYPDPYGRSDVRWHDGERWTPSVMRQGRREHDPV